jgi:hypothetical protein
MDVGLSQDETDGLILEIRRADRRDGLLSAVSLNAQFDQSLLSVHAVVQPQPHFGLIASIGQIPACAEKSPNARPLRVVEALEGPYNFVNLKDRRVRMWDNADFAAWSLAGISRRRGLKSQQELICWRMWIDFRLGKRA